jgi:hypothetical protein
MIKSLIARVRNIFEWPKPSGRLRGDPFINNIILTVTVVVVHTCPASQLAILHLQYYTSIMIIKLPRTLRRMLLILAVPIYTI